MQEPFYQGITDFIFMNDDPEKSDVIFLPGGHYPQGAVRAAQLYREGFAPLILPSGRFSKPVGVFEGEEGTEWKYLQTILLEQGIPENAILKEDRATFTWENAIFSRQVLEELNISVRKALLVCQAFHARRAYTYYKQQFPETRILVCPVITKDITKDNWFLDEDKTRVVLGELSRCGQQFDCMLPVRNKTFKNIKLIATDIDGTLLPEGTSDLNPECYDVIRKLKEKGVAFCAASGREYESIQRMFRPVMDDMIFMSENGGYMVRGDEEISRIIYEHSLLQEVIDYCRSVPNRFIMLSASRATYTDCTDEDFIARLEKGYGMAWKRVRSLEDVTDQIIKVAMYTDEDAAVTAEKANAYFDGRIHIMGAGAHWVDFVPHGVDKGSALKKLQEYLGITRENTVAFGDNLNDIGMLRQAGISYTVEEAREEVRQAADAVAGSCRNDGVLGVLKEIAGSL